MSPRSASFDAPLHETSEIVDHVGDERERKTVDVRSALTGGQGRDRRNTRFKALHKPV
jgi:hypothetical protein